MVLQGNGRFLKSESSRSLIYVSQKVAQDSAFPFKPGQELEIKIDAKGKRLVIQAA